MSDLSDATVSCMCCTAVSLSLFWATVEVCGCGNDQMSIYPDKNCHKMLDTRPQMSGSTHVCRNLIFSCAGLNN